MDILDCFNNAFNYHYKIYRKGGQTMELRVERMEDVFAAESIWYYVGYAVGKFLRSLVD